MRIAMAGNGAFANKHLDALARIDGAEVVTIIGREGDEAALAEAAEKHAIPDTTTDFDSVLAREDVDAFILTTPTQMHAAQSIACLDAGKHVMTEIPMADNLADSEALVAKQRETGLVAMVDHTRRFNPSHQWLHKQFANGDLQLQHLVVETYFFRRTNTNALGEPRCWTDHLLWHHAC
ncbi:MAG: Gfo/Idh/MocA family oxidoreductase, partial [Pseudomonadota bacterium]